MCWGNACRLDKAFPEKDIDALYQDGRSKTAEMLRAFSQKAHDAKDKEEFWRRWSQIREMISSLQSRVDYWENRRTTFLQIGMGLLAASIAGMLAIVVNAASAGATFTLAKVMGKVLLPVFTVKGLSFAGIFALCFIFFVGSLILLMIWNSQNNPPYPFTKGYRVWLWHYRHAEEAPLATDMHNFTANKFRNQARLFSGNLIAYKKRLFESSLDELLDQDTSHAYTLLINEKFKIDMVNRLRSCLMNTELTAVALAFFVFLLLLFVRAVA